MQTQTRARKNSGNGAGLKDTPGGLLPSAEQLEKLRTNATYGKLLRLAGGSYTRLEKQDLAGDMAGDGPAAFMGEPQCSFVPQEVHLFGDIDQTLSLTSVLARGQVTPLVQLPKPKFVRALRSYGIGGGITSGIGDPLVVQGATLASKRRHSVVVTGKSALAHDVLGSSVMSTSRCAMADKPRRYFEEEVVDRSGKKKAPVQYRGFAACKTRVPFACSLAAVEIATNALPGELAVYGVIAGAQSLTLDSTPLPAEIFMQPLGLPLESVPMEPMQFVTLSVLRAEHLGTKRIWFETTLYLSPVGCR